MRKGEGCYFKVLPFHSREILSGKVNGVIKSSSLSIIFIIIVSANIVVVVLFSKTKNNLNRTIVLPVKNNNHVNHSVK